MSDATLDDENVDERKSSKLPMIIGLVLALLGGSGGFFAVQSGFIGGATTEEIKEEIKETEEVDTFDIPDVAFIEIPQIVVSLPPNVSAKHLRFRASMEVPSQYATEVETLMPRIQDVLNGYLRALDPAEFERTGILIKLRGQMLRRLKIVAGEGRVRDLLVLEFVLN